MEVLSKFNIKDHYDDVENHSVGRCPLKSKSDPLGEYGFVKSGVSKKTGDLHCIKVIKKSKFSEDVLA